MFVPGLKAGLRVLLLATATFVLFGLSFLAFAWFLGWLRGGELFGEQNVILALICSLITWLFIAVFHLGKDNVVVPVTTGFVERAAHLLEEMGYEITGQGVDFIHTRPRFSSLLLGWGIHVEHLGSHARVTGPKIWVEMFRRRLRWQHHLDHAQVGLHLRRRDEQMVQRVHIQTRLAPEFFEALRHEVVAPLAEHGEVVCEVNLLVQSECGIRESLLDGPIRSWLEAHDVDAEVRKDLARIQEPRETLPV